MIASSAFVLAALTMTGIYMKSDQEEQLNDGYTIDFTSFENNIQEKMDEVRQGSEDLAEDNRSTGGKNKEVALGEEDLSGLPGLNNDLDYFPMEVGSGQIEIPGLTDGLQGGSLGNGENSAGIDFPAQGGTLVGGSTPVIEGEPAAEDTPVMEDTPTAGEALAMNEPESGTADESGQEEQSQNADSSEVIVETLHFSESNGLQRPVSGEVLIPFSMNTTVYFSTLDQFKCNPAVVLEAETGSAVLACAKARVIEVFENEEIGQAVTMELGDGYQITYGQLEAVSVAPGSQVEAGQVIGWIAEPTKYYCVEGSNLYLKLTSNGTPVDPEALFR